MKQKLVTREKLISHALTTEIVSFFTQCRKEAQAFGEVKEVLEKLRSAVLRRLDENLLESLQRWKSGEVQPSLRTGILRELSDSVGTTEVRARSGRRTGRVGHNPREMADLQTQVLDLNKQALDSLRLDDFARAKELLKRAESRLSECDSKAKSTTLNNWGCYYKRKKQLNVAGYFLRKALNQSPDAVSQAGIHLNLCTILSEAGKHAKALKQARKALALVEDVGETTGDETAVTTRVIGWQNAGAELEFVGQVGQAVEMYEKGEELARHRLGSKHGLTEQLGRCKAAARARFRAIHDFTEVRRSYRGRRRVPSHAETSFLLPALSRRPSHDPAQSKSARQRLGSLPNQSRACLKDDLLGLPEFLRQKYPHKALFRSQGQSVPHSISSHYYAQ